MPLIFKKLLKKISPFLIPFAVTLIVLFFVSAPFFHDGFFPMMDDVQVVRLEAMYKELVSGQFPVRYVDSFGNGGGYMFFNFYAPLTYFIGSIFHLLGFTLVKSAKLVFILYEFIGAFGMLVLLLRYTDKVSATIGTTLFLTATYINFNSYFRGSLGENFAIMLLPWLVLAIFVLIDKFTFVRSVFLGAIFATITITHSFIAVGAAAMTSGLFVISKFKKKNLLFIFIAFFFGLGLSAFFWIPSLLEQKYIVYDKTYFVTESYKGNFLNPLQIFGLQKIPWNFKPPFLGIGLFSGFILSLFMYWRNRKKFNKKFFFIFHLVVFFVSLFFVWNISKPLWDHVLFIRSFQFPYRFLGYVTFSSVVLTAIGLSQIKSNFKKIAIGILVILPSITFQFNYLRPSGYNYIATYTPDDICGSSTWAQEFLPVDVKECLPKKKKINLISLSNNKTTISNIVNNNGRNISFKTSGDAAQIQIAKYYFPGWESTVNGRKVRLYPEGKHGLISFRLPRGNNIVNVSFRKTKTREIADIVSLIAFFALIILALLYSFKFKIRSWFGSFLLK